MNFGKERRRKHSVCEVQAHAFGAESDGVHSRGTRCRNFPGKPHSRERDFFAPEEIEEWVLPEYRSLFHHLFLKDEEDLDSPAGGSGIGSRVNAGPITSSKSISSVHAPRRKISPSGSTGSSAGSDDDGPLCNLVKSLPTWLKKVFNISENNNNHQHSEEVDRHVWLDEIPIEICDKLRHIHIYV